jgi:hypothetical protein
VIKTIGLSSGGFVAFLGDEKPEYSAADLISDLRAELLERTIAHEKAVASMWVEAGHMPFELYKRPMNVGEREEIIETQCEGYGQKSFWEWRNSLKAKVPFTFEDWR